MPNTIKTAIDYPPKFALRKVKYVSFLKLAQITKTLIISGRLCFSLPYTLSSTSSTHNYYSTSQIIGFKHFKIISVVWYHWWRLRWYKQWFGTDGYAVIKKRSVCFWTKVTISLKFWSGIWVKMRKMREIRVAM